MDLSPVVLQGNAVSLVPLSFDHLDGLHKAGSDAAIWRYMTGDCITREAMEEFIRTALAWQKAGTAVPFVTVSRLGEVVGSTRFANIVAEHKRAEIGWTWIAPAFQRTAINTEAKYLMLRHAFETMGCNRVELKTNALNRQSRNAILRIGAKEEGILRSHMVNPDGTPRDTVYFSVIAPEWPEVRARLEGMIEAGPSRAVLPVKTK